MTPMGDTHHRDGAVEIGEGSAAEAMCNCV
jgi:hypothetical protein